MFCNKCGKRVHINATFCYKCRTRFIFCFKCGSRIVTDVLNCPNCGKSLEAEREYAANRNIPVTRLYGKIALNYYINSIIFGVCVAFILVITLVRLWVGVFILCAGLGCLLFMRYDDKPIVRKVSIALLSIAAMIGVIGLLSR